MKKIGVTGNIGSGKSQVRKNLQKWGYACWDADDLNREILQDPQVIAKIAHHFFPHEIQNPDSTINAKALGSLVFTDPSSRKWLESLLHPLISQSFMAKSAEVFRIIPHAWVFYEASLILESGKQNQFDALVYLDTPAQIRAQRLKESRNMDAEKFQIISQAQWSDDRKKELCHFVLSNAGTTQELEEEILQLLIRLRRFFGG